MKLAALAIVSLLAVAACAPDAPPATGFAAAAPIAGTKHEVMLSQVFTVTLAYTKDGNELPRFERSQRHTLACSVLVEAADATAASAATLAFGECNRKRLNLPEDVKAEPTCFSGKSYAAKRGDSGFVVSGEDELSDEEKHATDALVTHLLGAAPLAPLLVGKPLIGGDVIEVPTALAQACFGYFGAGVKVESLTLVLAEEPVARSTIVFKATAKLAIPPSARSPGELTIEPVGTWHVSRSTCRITAIAMQGPVKVRGSLELFGVKVDMKADGEWTLAWSVATK